MNQAFVKASSWLNIARQNQIVQNSLYNLFGFAMPLILLLVFTPLLVDRMGTENYGLWILATSSLGLMGMFEFGLGATLIKYVAEYSTNQDSEGLSATVTTAFTLYLIIGILLTVAIYILAPQLGPIFSSSTLPPGRIGTAIQLASLGFLPSLLRNGSLAIPRGLQRFKIPTVIMVGQNTFILLAALTVVSWNGSIEKIILSTVLTLWLFGLSTMTIAWLQLQKLDFQLMFSRLYLRQMFSFMGYMSIIGIGQRIFNSVDRVAVGAILNLSAVTYYTVAIGIANKLVGFSNALTIVLMPAASSWQASGSKFRLWKYFLFSTSIITLISLSLGGLILYLSEPFLRLWMGNEFANQALTPFRILILIYMVIPINASSFHIGNGIGKPWIGAISIISGGFLTIGLITILGYRYGLEGVAWANAGYWLTLIMVPVTAIKLSKITTEKYKVNQYDH